MPDNPYQVGNSPNYAAGLMNWQDIFSPIDQTKKKQPGAYPPNQPPQPPAPPGSQPPPQQPAPVGLGGYLQRWLGGQGAPQGGPAPADNSWSGGWNVNG